MNGSLNLDSPVYIAGPMTGLPEFNYPLFNLAEGTLKGRGFLKVHNPASIAGGNTTLPYDYYLREGFKLLIECSTIVLLPGWEKSKGAGFELTIAKMLNMDILEFFHGEYGLLMRKAILTKESPTPTTPAETICQEADRLVSEDRMNQYGHPKDDFKRIATIWGVILGKDDIRPEQIAMCMIGTKLSRMCHEIKRDSIVDISGYAKTISMILDL